jgi:hypothetical protein
VLGGVDTTGGVLTGVHVYPIGHPTGCVAIGVQVYPTGQLAVCACADCIDIEKVTASANTANDVTRETIYFFMIIFKLIII